MNGNETMRMVQREQAKGKSTLLFLILGLAVLAFGIWQGHALVAAAGAVVTLGAFFLQPGLRKRLGSRSLRYISRKMWHAPEDETI